MTDSYQFGERPVYLAHDAVLVKDATCVYRPRALLNDSRTLRRPRRVKATC
jgi:hypothetical protein